MARCPNDFYLFDGQELLPEVGRETQRYKARARTHLTIRSNYQPWGTGLGGVTPCYSPLRATITPLPLAAGLAPVSAMKPTSAVVNVVWAMQYPVAGPLSGELSAGAKAGIGAGRVAATAYLAFRALRDAMADRRPTGDPQSVRDIRHIQRIHT